MADSSSSCLHFPRFDGSGLLDWISKTTRFFNDFDTPDDQRLIIASYHIDGDAFDWFNFEQPFNSWNSFLKASVYWFGPLEWDEDQGRKFVESLSSISDCTSHIQENVLSVSINSELDFEEAKLYSNKSALGIDESILQEEDHKTKIKVFDGHALADGILNDEVNITQEIYQNIAPGLRKDLSSVAKEANHRRVIVVEIMNKMMHVFSHSLKKIMRRNNMVYLMKVDNPLDKCPFQELHKTLDKSVVGNVEEKHEASTRESEQSLRLEVVETYLHQLLLGLSNGMSLVAVDDGLWLVPCEVLNCRPPPAPSWVVLHHHFTCISQESFNRPGT